MASARNPAMASSLSGGGEAVRPELLSMITQLISEGRSQPRSTRAALNVQAEPILASGPFEPAERAGAFQGAASKILNGVSEEMGVAQGDGTKDLGQSRGDESISQEHLTHLLVRVLVKGCIVPLTALSGDDMYAGGVVSAGFTVPNALVTLGSTLQDHPKALEHLFKSAHNGAGNAESNVLASEERMNCTTLDLWLGPRMLAAATVATVRCSMETNEAKTSKDARAKPMLSLSQLRADLIDKLLLVLNLSLESVNQLDNVRLLLFEFLRAAVDALSQTDQPAFSAGTHLPSTLTPRSRPDDEVMEDPTSRASITFFKDGLNVPEMRMSSREDRPKPSGNGIAGVWTTQDHTPFTMALFDPMRGQHSVHQLAHSLLLSAIQVVLNMSGTCAESLADLADIALRLLIGSWQRDLEGETQGLPFKPLPPVLRSLRLNIAADALGSKSALSLASTCQLAALITRSFSMARQEISTVDEEHDVVFEALERALRMLRSRLPKKAEQKHSSTILSACSPLLPLAGALAADIAAYEAHEWPQHDGDTREHEKAEVSITYRIRSCNVQALILMLEGGVSAHSLLSSGDRKVLWETVCRNTERSERAPANVWLKPEDRRALKAALEEGRRPARGLKRKRGVSKGTLLKEARNAPDSTTSATKDDVKNYFAANENALLADTEDGVLYKKIMSDHQSTESLRIAAMRISARLACAGANSLTKVNTFAENMPPFSCSICDSSRGSENVSCLSSDNASDGLNALNAQVAAVAGVVSHASGPVALAALDAVRCNTAHAAPAAVASMDLSGASDLAKLLADGLTHPDRGVRLATGQFASVIARKHRIICKQDESEALGKRLATLFRVHESVLKTEKPKLKETIIISLGALGRIDEEDVLAHVLEALILQLGHHNAMIKSLAYAQLVALSSHHRRTTFKLVFPFLESISAHLVEHLTSAPDILLEMLRLIGDMRQRDFLSMTLQYTVPHLIALRKETTLKIVASAIGKDVPTMCFQQAPAVLKHFLMFDTAQRDAGIKLFLGLVRGNGGAMIDMSSIFKSYLVQILTHLVIQLGVPTSRPAAERGLQYVEAVVSEAAPARRKSNNKQVDVGSFLREHVLGILSSLNDILNDGQGKKSASHKATVVRSVGALVEVVGSTISLVTPQIMATLNSTLQVPELMQPTLESWHTFVSTLRFEDIGPFIGQTAAALVSAWPHFNKAEVETASAILRYVILENGSELKSHLNEIPSLDDLEADIPDVGRKLRSLRTQWSHQQHLEQILIRVASENAAVCLQSLQELRRFLRERRSYMENLASGDAFDPLVGDTVRVLFSTATRADDHQAQIRDLCFECIGILGAVDPDRFDFNSEDAIQILLHNFNDKDESIEFAIHLVRDLLVSAFRATDDTKHQAQLAYAIQELLKFCGFSPALLLPTSNSKPVAIKVRQRWSELPKAILDTVSPLLDSKYSVMLGEPRPRQHPIYLNSTSYRDWIQGWANHLILGARGDDARTIFGIFRAVIRNNDTAIAQHILPHLVLNILISGEEAQRDEVRNEFVAVLTDQVDPKTGFEPERRLLAAQTIFGLMDHLSVWIRRKRLEGLRHQSRRNREQPQELSLLNVESIMSSISQELMAQASLQCKAYARSLLNFEQRVRTLKTDTGRHDRDLQTYYENMHQIYANLDEPDGMEGISTKVISPSLEHQIREHESTGRWTAAQSCWEVKLQQRPDDPNLHLGLLRCLRNLGHFDTLRTHIRGVLSKYPAWEALLSTYQVEGSCILADWEEVASAVSRPGMQGPEHAIARVLLAMRSDDNAAFSSALSDARRQLGSPLIAAGKGSYSRVYDSVTQLHMLHELEMINELVCATTPSGQKLRSLNQSLVARLNSTLPSFRTREPLLSLRRSAFSTRDSSAVMRGEVGQSWVSTSKIARRAGHIQTAYSAVLQAVQCQAPFAFVQRAKLLALSEQTQGAIQELNNALQSISAAASSLTTSAGSTLIDLTKDGSEVQPDGGPTIDPKAYAKANLLRARLVESTSRFQPNEVIEKYKESSKLDTRSEKTWYYLGHFYDSQREENIVNTYSQDYYVCRYYLRSAERGTKFFYRTLPRVLTIWLDTGDDPKLAQLERNNKLADHANDKDLYDKQQTFRRMNDLIGRGLRTIAPYQWLAVFPQLVSRVVHKNDAVWKHLQEIIATVIETYPQQAMWSLVAGMQSTDSARKARCKEVVQRVKSKAGRERKETVKILDNSQKLAKELLAMSEYPVNRETSFNLPQHFPKLAELASCNLILPLQSSVTVNLPANNIALPDHRPFPSDLPYIAGFLPQIDIMPSLQKPRKLIILGSDGRQYPFLCKPKDDLRKDARLMEFDSMINKLLQTNSESRKRRLHIRTYSVVTLNEECGFIEWVPNTVGLRHILTRLYAARGIPLYTHDIKTNLDEARLNPKKAAEIFESRVLSKYPSVFHEWFLATFPEPSAWLKARLAYSRTLAVMSMVGFVLGLGDRHGENILFDANTGDTVHVDFNCLFEKGKQFDIPEQVPFRLTHNMVDALGVTGPDGAFRRSAEVTLGILRDNKESLMSVLETLVHDPLLEFAQGHKSRSKNQHNPNLPDPRVLQARKALDPIGWKLDGRSMRSEDEPGPKSSVGTQVDTLIRDATSSTLLAQMYVGWASYL